MKSLVCTFALLAASTASAQVVGTQRTNSFELRMGAYKPNIDDSFGAACATNTCPYEAVFKNEDPLMLMFVFNRHLFTQAGTLSAGFGLGYWNVEGQSLLDGLHPSNDSTELSVFPMQGQLSYHLDTFQDTVPLVPVIGGGLDYYYWRILDGEGDVASFEPGKPASGGTLGWHYMLGIHILLDYFAPRMAADFDRDAGVNNSYITIEYQKSDLTDFGSSTAFRLGSEVLFFGLALDL